MKLAIDLGNTYCKIAFFEDNKLQTVQERLLLHEARRVLESAHPEAVVIVDVTDRAEDLLKNLSFSPKILVLKHDTPLPIKNLYGTPHSLGMDRLAAVLGAYTVAPNHNHLVIDAGTCITYDFITKKGEYLGGSISLGLQMRRKALPHFTQKLPLVALESKESMPPLVGKDTQSAILSGVFYGFLSEVHGVIAHYESQFGEFQTWICGGDGRFLSDHLTKKVLFRPTLLLEGLQALMQFHGF